MFNTYEFRHWWHQLEVSKFLRLRFSLQGIITELHPLLRNTTLEQDLQALVSGLGVIRQLKNYTLEEVNLKGQFLKKNVVIFIIFSNNDF